MYHLISIITISYNTYSDFLETFLSVTQQHNQNFEFVVIDAESTDLTKEFLDKKPGRIDKLIREKDSGIFNAMNKGIKVCSGDYIIFLNSGDVFFDINVTDKLLSYIENNDFDLLCGDYFTNGKIYKAKQNGTDPIELPTCHQSMIFKRDESLLFYDEKLKLFSDIDLYARYFLANKKINFIDFVISKYKGGGFSTRRSYDSFVSRVILITRYKGFLGLLKYVFKKFTNFSTN